MLGSSLIVEALRGKTYTRSIATAAQEDPLPRTWNQEGTGSTAHELSCDAGYRATSYPAEQWLEWGKQTEAEYFLPEAGAIDVAKDFIGALSLSFKRVFT